MIAWTGGWVVRVWLVCGRIDDDADDADGEGEKERREEKR